MSIDDCEPYRSMTELVEAVTCSIHLGLLENPRQLPCGHAFCLECINQCARLLKPGQFWPCPLCRKLTALSVHPEENAQLLSRACIHNSIMAYIDKHKIPTSSAPPCGSGGASSSNCTDAQLTATLEALGRETQQGPRRSESISKLALVNRRRRSSEMSASQQHVHEDNCGCGDSPSPPPQYCRTAPRLSLDNTIGPLMPTAPPIPSSHSSRIGSTTGLANGCRTPGRSRHASFSANLVSTDVTPFASVFQLYDMDAIRGNMRRNSNYHAQNHHKVYVRRGSGNGSSSDPMRLTSGHCVCCKKDTDAISSVFLVNGASRDASILIREGKHKKYLKMQLFPDGQNKNPKWESLYLQCDDSYLYILLLRVDRKTLSRHLKIAQFDFRLNFLKESNEIPDGVAPQDSVQADLLRRISFHLSKSRGLLYIPLPLRCEIVTLRLESLTAVDVFALGDYHPAHLTQVSFSQELWISCPKEKCVLIMDEENRRIQQLQREHMYNALPTNIVTTSDDRVIMVDAKLNCLLWLHKRGNYLLVQRLDFHCTLRRAVITGLQPLPDGRLLITSEDSYIVGKPNGNASSDMPGDDATPCREQGRHGNSCQIL